ncbi:MAG: thiamine biosynthesis protein [Myxococcales bacterium]|jgi:tRNA-specific 2-thiouridylase
MTDRKARAIGLLSGGLDSLLAHALMRAQGVEVRAINFYTGFCILETQRRLGRKRPDGSTPRNDALQAGATLETEVELVDISGPDYLRMVTHPKYGYGANANPCIDCRIFMFSKARELMEQDGYDFVFTGEVLGQRPKSQRRETMRIIDRDSGLEGRLLRPLSAKLLEPTIPEKEGLVDRERLFDISGRSRKPQMELARKLGITEYPQPAGGCCFLTDETFGRRFHDLMRRKAERRLEQEEVILLATGRHFDLGLNAKLVVSRNETENLLLLQYTEGRYALEAKGVNGPIALVEGEPDERQRELASRIVGRYGKGKDLERVTIEWRRGGESTEVGVEPYRSEAEFEKLRI